MSCTITPFSRRLVSACLLALALRADVAHAQRVQSALTALPMRFEPNLGRVAGADFIARGPGYAVLISRHDTTLMLPTPSSAGATVRMRLAGASLGAPGIGLDPLPGVSNHFSGRDARRWRTGVRGYGRIQYRDVYPGVNVVYYGNQEQLEYDFVVDPGASYRRIGLTFEGADRVGIDADGNLILSTAAGDLVHRRPIIYQQRADGTRSTIDGGYVVRSGGRVGFRIGTYDRRRALVIDPVLTYSTYLGGTGSENPYAIAVDGDANIYVAGETSSLDFPVVNGQPPTPGGSSFLDAFVAKINAAGNALVYATYLGGSQPDTAADIAVDAGGSAYIAGYTFSPDFPTVGAIQTALKGASDAFVTKLDPNGGVVYSTYLGGTEQEIGYGIAVDAFDRALVTGLVLSTDFPVVSPMQSTPGGSPALRTIDSGRTWQAIETGMRSTSIRGFAIDPTDTARIYAVSGADGLFASTDGGDSWARIDAAGLPTSAVNAIAIAPTMPPTLYIGAETGVFRSTDGGATWAPVFATTSYVTALAIDAVSPTTIYATQRPGFNVYGVFKSTDGGESWVDTGLQDAPDLLVASETTVYAGSLNGVHQNIAGAGWSRVFIGEIRALAADPANASIVYAGSFDGVFKSTSGGASWDLILPGGPITALAVASSDPNTVYAATESDGLLWSADAGATWQRVHPSAFYVSTLLVDPQNPARAYAGSYVSADGFVSLLSADGSTLEYSTYLGGAGWESANDVAVDASGNAYVVGTTNSRDFPTLNGAQTARSGFQDVFVAKLSTTGSLAYGTYLGGTDYQEARTIGVDSAGQAYVAGHTNSADFPVANAHQPAWNGFYDMFVTKLTAAGDGLVYSTFLGGTGHDYDVAIAVSPSGTAVVTGTTTSSNFPTRNPVQPALRGSGDATVAKFDPDGQLLYSTYLGGTGWEFGRRAAIDSSGAAVIVGSTDSNDFPTKSALQPNKSGPGDLFISRIVDAVPDTTPPALTIGSPQTRSYLHSDALTIEIAATDGGSGLAPDSPSARLDGTTVANGQAVSLLTLSLGSHVLTVSASDVAGNFAQQSATFTIVATIDSVIAAVNTFATQGKVDAGSQKTLLSKLNDAKAALARGNPTAARSKLRDAIDYTNAHSGKGITLAAAALLAADMQYVLGTF